MEPIEELTVIDESLINMNTVIVPSSIATPKKDKRERERDKSKKKQTVMTIMEKQDLWNIFDTHVTNPSKKDVPLECVYGSGNRENCERCGSILAFSEEGFLCCTNTRCSIIYKDLVDHSAEWRFYGTDDNHHVDPTRCGMPINPLLEESSYGCKVVAFGRMSYELRKMKRYSEWQSMPYKEKAQYDEFQRITTMANIAGIPKIIIDSAIRYHKKISDSDVTFRGDNRDGIIAASIYVACRINNYPRTPKEIATIFNLDTTHATKGCKNALSIINDLEKDMEHCDRTVFCKTKPESFIDRYCSKLNINDELTKLCKFISLKIEKMDVMPENTPPSIAAGVVYFVAHLCRLNINKRDIKTVSETSEVTINKCHKKLEKIMQDNKLIPAAIVKKYNIVLTSS